MALNELVLSIVSESFRNSARRVAPTLEEYILSLYNGGLDKDSIRNLLLGPRGEELIFGPLQRAFGYTAGVNVERTRQQTRADIFKSEIPDKLLRWELDPGKEHCEDCIDRATREPMTMGEWELIGTPGAGTTKCNINCWCKLTPVKS